MESHFFVLTSKEISSTNDEIESKIKKSLGANCTKVNLNNSRIAILGKATENQCKNVISELGIHAINIINTQPDVCLAVEGMMCQKNCGSTVANALRSVSNVFHTIVQFEKKEALVWGDNLVIHDLIDAVECVGFDAVHVPSSSITILRDIVDDNGQRADLILNISSTNNNISRASIESALSTIDGVMSSKIDLKNKIVYIWGFAERDIVVDTFMSSGFLVNVLMKEPEIAATLSSSSNMKSKVNKTKPKEKSPTSTKEYSRNITQTQENSKNILQTQIKSKEHSRNIPQTEKKISSSCTSNSPEFSQIACLQITGMSSASCVKKIENALANNNVPGIAYCKVSLLTQRAEVSFRPSDTNADAMIVCIEELGYGCKVVEVREFGTGSSRREYMFKVSGMSCANCALKVERTLRAVGSNVLTADVSCMTDKARVLLTTDVTDDPGSVGPRDICEIVQSLGYGCEIDDETNPTDDNKVTDLVIWTRLLIAALLLGLPVTVLHVYSMQSSTLMHAMNEPLLCKGGITAGQTAMLVLNVPMQFGVGYKYYRSAFLGAIHGSLGMDFLVVTGTTITFMYSMLQLYFACQSHVPSRHVFLEASGMLLLFVTVGKYMEAYAKGKTASAITDLLRLQPRHALLVVSSTEAKCPLPLPIPMNTVSSPKQHKTSYGSLELMTAEAVPVLTDLPTLLDTSTIPTPRPIQLEAEEVREIKLDLVQRGDLLKVLPGSRIPTDGIIESGSTFIDESMITGESVPVARSVGDMVFGSTVNQNHLIFVRVTSVGAESALAQIVKLVESAQMNKAPVQAYADRIAGLFTPVVLAAAAITFATWYSLCLLHLVPDAWFAEEYGDPLLFSMLFAISVVVISCPCALGLATPTAIMVGTAVGAHNGILIKGGSAFEVAHKVTVVIFDKTGTLTEGKPSVTDEIPMLYDESSSSKSVLGFGVPGESPRDRLLRIAASVEQSSEHPLAVAIVKAAKARNLQLYRIEENSFTSVTGFGVQSTLVSHEEGLPTVVAQVGNRAYMESNSTLVTPTVDAAMWDLEIQGKTAVIITCNGRILGVLGIADTAKPEARSTVDTLRTVLHVDVWMVTGDNRTTAETVGNELYIGKDRVLAGVLPGDKVSKILELQALGHVVAMVGDGINDSPALAQADVGIAIGGGTHVAVQAADMVLVRNNLQDVVVALDLSRVVFRRIQWNFLWAVLYNVLAVPYAAGVWFPWTRRLLPPQYAGLSMALSSISVVASSMAIRCYTRPTFLDRGDDDDEKMGAGHRRSRHRSRSILENAKRGFTNIKDAIKDKVTGGAGGGGPRYRPLPMEDQDQDGYQDRDQDEERGGLNLVLGLDLGLGGISGLKGKSGNAVIENVHNIL